MLRKALTTTDGRRNRLPTTGNERFSTFGGVGTQPSSGLEFGTGEVDAEQVGGEDAVLYAGHAVVAENLTAARNRIDHPNPFHAEAQILAHLVERFDRCVFRRESRRTDTAAG
jgi:hypothetical protein